MNALTQQEACIVDSTPGTTADVKTILLELHALGPAKVLDTAGLDEQGGVWEWFFAGGVGGRLRCVRGMAAECGGGVGRPR